MRTSELVLRIKLPANWDHLNFVESVANNQPVTFTGCQVLEVTDVFESFQDEILLTISKDGLSNILNRKLLLEAIVTPSHTTSFISSLMIDFLNGISIDNELIIVDPYFFVRSDQNYVSLVQSIITPFISRLDNIKIITLPNKVDTPTKQSIETMIKNMKPTMNILHATSNDYHDRFWISSQRTNGLVTGTSLNGLGRKYALIDKLDPLDVTDIVSSLQGNNLI